MPVQTQRWVLSAHTGSTPFLHGEGLPISMRHWGPCRGYAPVLLYTATRGFTCPPHLLPPLSIFLCLPWQLLAYHLLVRGEHVHRLILK